MKRLNFLTAIISFLLSLSLSAQTLDEILAKHFEVINQEKLITVKSVFSKAKILQGGMEIPLVIYQKRPLKLKTEASFQGMTAISAYDGETGWSINPFMGNMDPQPMSKEEVERLKDQADIDGYLYNYKEKGYTLELLPEEEIEGTKVYVIKLTKENGDEITHYMDADNYVVLKIRSRMKIQGVENEIEGFLSNYKPVEDILMPFNFENKLGGQTMMEMVVDSVEFNKEMPDSIFVMPVTK